MTCFKNIFRCNFTEADQSFLRQKIIDIELDIKSMKVAHDLEIKRIEDKLIHQIQILSTKIDGLLLIFNK